MTKLAPPPLRPRSHTPDFYYVCISHFGNEVEGEGAGGEVHKIGSNRQKTYFSTWSFPTETGFHNCSNRAVKCLKKGCS